MTHGRCRHGRHALFGRLDRDRLLDRLEEYQRDLEQEVADVADLIRRLRDGEAQPAGA